MDPALRAQIFEPFFTTKPKSEGTGLGLAIVVGLVERCLGRIDVHSTPGHGSIFTIDLPLITRSDAL
jgi:signal transduction histidine kinase